MVRFWSHILALIGLIAPVIACADVPEVVYRSDLLVRTTGQPNVYGATFTPCDPTGSFRLVFENGAEGGSRVEGATVLLNGPAVIESRDVNQQVARVERPVVLKASNAIEVSLASTPGGRVRVTVDGYMRCLRVRLTAPHGGSVLHEPATLVEGEIESRGPVSLRLRMSAALRGEAVELFVPVAAHGPRFAAWAPLPVGPVQFTVIASDQAGRTVEDTVAVTFEPDPPANDRALTPDVSPTVGFAPLVVTFTGDAATDGEVERLDLDVDGDGQADFTVTDFAAPPHQVTYTYRAEGLYVTTMVIRERTTGRVITASVPINVIPVPDLSVIWSDFRAALERGDVDGALRFVADEARERYRLAFTDLGADLSAVAAEH